MRHFKHTFATDLRKDGFGLDVIAKLLGHSDLRQTKRYAHLGDELLVEAVRSLEGKYIIN
jgi:site-specific recombinase XerD